MAKIKTSRKWLAASAGGVVIALAVAMGAHFEGESTTAYQDVGGVWTICYGHTAGVKTGDTASPEQCRQWLREEMTEAYGYVRKCIHVPLTIGQQVAFTDAAYNLGPSVVCGSTLQRLANAGDVTGACKQLSRWVYAKGQRLNGLVKRRAAEEGVCLHGIQ